MNEEFFKKMFMNDIQIAYSIESGNFTCWKNADVFTGSWEECINQVKTELNRIIPPKMLFDVTVLYDKGYGSECLTLAQVEATTIENAQKIAEENAKRRLVDRFGKNCICEEVKIRPALNNSF